MCAETYYSESIPDNGIDRLLARLTEFDALRDSDTVNRTELARVQPSHATPLASGAQP